MKIRCEECQIIGGMRAARGGAAFARAPLVLECQGKRYIAGRIAHGEPVKAEPLSDEEWRGVLASGEALELLNHRPATPNAALWLLRSNFSFRDEVMHTLAQRQAVIHHETSEGTFVVLVDESAASGLTEQWAGRAFNEAWKLAGAQRLSEAVEAAELAMELARGFQVDHVALLAVLYERAGDKERGEAILEFARNSRGDAFHDRAREKKQLFAAELSIPSMTMLTRPRFPTMASRFVAGVSTDRGKALDTSFGKFRDKDAA